MKTILLSALAIVPIMLGPYLIAAAIEAALAPPPEAFTTTLLRVSNAGDARTFALASVAQGLMTGVSATYTAVLYRRLARRPRSLGKEIARVFR